MLVQLPPLPRDYDRGWHDSFSSVPRVAHIRYAVGRDHNCVLVEYRLFCYCSGLILFVDCCCCFFPLLFQHGHVESMLESD